MLTMLTNVNVYKEVKFYILSAIRLFKYVQIKIISAGGNQRRWRDCDVCYYKIVIRISEQN